MRWGFDAYITNTNFITVNIPQLQLEAGRRTEMNAQNRRFEMGDIGSARSRLAGMGHHPRKRDKWRKSATKLSAANRY